MTSPETLPKEFLESVKSRLGREAEEFLRALTQPSPVSIRLNPYKKTNPPAGASPIPWASTGWYLPERPVFTLDPLFHAGAFYVQEASSMFLEQVFQQRTAGPLRVLDLCAAPGGKSTHIASVIPRDSLLVSNEVIRSRASVLSENMQKWGCDHVVVTNNDPEDFTHLTGVFDVIVVDAPCSGEGLFRKDPEAQNEWSPDHVQLCSRRQQRILKDIWPALKENGLLVYCTCTYNSSENEDTLTWLQATYDVENVNLDIPDNWNIVTTSAAGITGYRFYPHRVKGEGFFLSVMRKTQPEETIAIRSKKTQAVPRKLIDTVAPYLIQPESRHWSLWNDVLYMTPSPQADMISMLQQHLRIVTAGTYLGTFKHDKFIPEHALALSVDLNQNSIPIIELTLENALRFLKKETMDIHPSVLGYTLVTYQHLPLGWINALGNRVNNLYPKEWRIRMAV